MCVVAEFKSFLYFINNNENLLLFKQKQWNALSEEKC